jgi:beta-galactosidase
MAHFWLPYNPGVIRAEGYRNGVKVTTDVLHTAKQAAMVKIIAPVKAVPNGIVPVEIWLLDKYDEPWVLENPKAYVGIKGDAELIALDNGDMCSPETYTASWRSFWNGHILALVRIGGSQGMVRIRVETEGMNSVWHDVKILF